MQFHGTMTTKDLGETEIRAAAAAHVARDAVVVSVVFVVAALWEAYETIQQRVLALKDVDVVSLVVDHLDAAIVFGLRRREFEIVVDDALFNCLDEQFGWNPFFASVVNTVRNRLVHDGLARRMQVAANGSGATVEVGVFLLLALFDHLSPLLASRFLSLLHHALESLAATLVDAECANVVFKGHNLDDDLTAVPVFELLDGGLARAIALFDATEDGRFVAAALGDAVRVLHSGLAREKR